MKMALFFLFRSVDFFSLHTTSLFSLNKKCLIPLDVTVKGHWERLTLPDTLYYILIFYYLQQIEQSNN